MGVPPWAPHFRATQGAHGGTPLQKFGHNQHASPIMASHSLEVESIF